MGNEEAGECSRHSNAKPTTKPLKKAKYVWQVKGNYHLKTNTDSKSPDNNLTTTTKHGIDRFLANTETFLENLESDEDNASANEVPISLVSQMPQDDDYFLKKWQARQIARGYIDNTINSVLERLVPSDPFDAEDFVDKCAEDGHVEDEGILMAIQAHGLQSNDLSKRGRLVSLLRPDEIADNTFDKIDSIVQAKQLNIVVEEEEKVGNVGNGLDLEVDYPLDLLDIAVRIAIDKKGLTPLNDQ